MNQTLPIFCINLDRSKDRWLKIKDQELTLNGPKIERIPAVDGSIMDKGELIKQNKITPLCYNICSAGMIGCWLSHLKIWKKIVNEKIPLSVVIEDDAEFPTDYKNKIKNLMPFIPENADIVLLGCAAGCRESEDLNLLEKSLGLLYKPRDFATINQEIIIPRMFIGSYAYLITFQGAQKCINLFSKAHYHIDHEISRNPNINLYAVRKKDEWFKTTAFSNSSTLNGNNESYQKETKFLDNDFSLQWLINAPIAELPYGITINAWLIMKIIFIILIFLLLKYSFTKSVSNKK